MQTEIRKLNKDRKQHDKYGVNDNLFFWQLQSQGVSLTGNGDSLASDASF